MRASQLSETEVSTVVTGQARISADFFNNQLDIAPSGPAAFSGLIFETDKRSRSGRVRGAKILSLGLKLFKPLEGLLISGRNAKSIRLAISCLGRGVEPSICKLARKESESGARAMPAIRLTSLHHWLALVIAFPCTKICSQNTACSVIQTTYFIFGKPLQGKDL